MEDVLLPLVGLVEFNSEDDTVQHESLSRLFELVGGLEKYVKSGQTVLLKPHLAELSRKSHLALVASVACQVTRLGARVQIGDSPWLVRTSVEAHWEKTGLKGLASENDWELVNFEKAQLQSIALDTHMYHLPVPVMEADLVINIAPSLRDHRARMAGAMFNLLGTIPGDKSGQLPAGLAGSERFNQAVVDILAIVSPGLNIVDMYVNDTDLSNKDNYLRRILASRDAVALDMVVAMLVGLQPQEVPAIGMAAEAGLGVGWPDSIRLVGDRGKPWPFSALKAFKSGGRAGLPEKLKTFIEMVLPHRPDMDHGICKTCGKYVDCCPVGAIAPRSTGTAVHFYPDLCIKCWHCRHTCAEQSVIVRRPWPASSSE